MSSEVSELVTLIERRQSCLQTLATTPESKQELVNTLDRPRSTLDDIVRELERSNLVEYEDGKWHLTDLGRQALDLHADYKNRLSSLIEAAPIIDELPRDTVVGCRFLIDADVHVASTPVPDDVIRVFLDAIDSANRIRSFTPIAMAGHAEAFYDHATSRDECQLDVVLPPDVIERLRDLYPEGTDKAISDDRTTFYAGEVPMSFSLWIADDDHAGIIVYAERGIQGVLVNDTTDAVSWATEQFERVQEGSNPISRPQLTSSSG